MTLLELSKYYKLHERLNRNKEILSSLSAAAGPGAQVLTGMPYTPTILDYGFKTTTHGRAVIAACGALETPLKLTRVEVGSGMVGEETNLADVHALLHYEAEAAITERRHEDDRLYLTVQYCNSEHPDVGTFYLSEFIVYAENPETGQETDLLYATLGDYRQGVPAYRPSLPASTWNFPMILVVSDEIEVSVAASPGLVTWDDLTPRWSDTTRPWALSTSGTSLPHGQETPLCRITDWKRAAEGKERRRYWRPGPAPGRRRLPPLSAAPSMTLKT